MHGGHQQPAKDTETGFPPFLCDIPGRAKGPMPRASRLRVICTRGRGIHLDASACENLSPAHPLLGRRSCAVRRRLQLVCLSVHADGMLRPRCSSTSADTRLRCMLHAPAALSTGGHILWVFALRLLPRPRLPCCGYCILPLICSHILCPLTRLLSSFSASSYNTQGTVGTESARSFDFRDTPPTLLRRSPALFMQYILVVSAALHEVCSQRASAFASSA